MIPTFRTEPWLRSVAAAALAASLSLFTVVPAAAQDTEAAAAEEEDLIIVTGSRIARDANLDSPTAVVTFDSAAIDLQGASNLADILRESPSSGVSGITGTNSNFTLASAGINTLELRNLGEDRTLILVNSKRFVAGLPGTNIVDINQIPTALVERVEVITGGASSIYGSDALAGVINIILMDDFSGIETELKYGKDEFGTNEEWEAGITVGGNFDNGRGNAVAHFNYVQNLGIPSNSRPNLLVDDFSLCRLTNDPNDCGTPFEPAFSSFPPQGRFLVENAATGITTSFTIRDGEIVQFVGSIDGFNRQPFRRVSVPVERFLFSGKADYEIWPWMTAYLEGFYGSTEANSHFEPVPLGSDDIFGTQSTGVPVVIPGIGGDIFNPLIPDDLLAAALAAGDDNIGFVRRLLELGPRGSTFLRQTFRTVGGLKGDFTAFDDKKYNWEIFFNYGRTTRTQSTSAGIIVSNFQDALDIEQVLDDSGFPVLQCRDEVAREQRGCVPIDIFGIGAISPEAADFVRAVELRDAKIRQEQYGGTFSGPVPYLKLPAGDIQLAGGVEYRRESSIDEPAGLTQAGLSSSNQNFADSGSFNVFETFGEMEVPILRDLPFAQNFIIGAAVRYSSYNPQGETLAYSARASFQPVEELRFRFQYSRAVRAPNIDELFAVGTENFAVVTDPCLNVTLATTGSTAENCRADPAVLARINAIGGFFLSVSETQAAGGFSGTGNRDLSPEIGTSYLAGMVYNDDLGKAGDVTFSVDWFDIFIDGFIAQPGRSFSASQCYASGVPFPNSPFCDFIVRDTSGLPSQQGEILEVNTGNVNAGFASTAGVDFAFNYNLDLNGVHEGGIPSLGLKDLGTATFNILYTYLYENESEIFGSFDSDVGTVGIFEHEIQGTFTYRNGPLTFQWQSTWNDGGPLNTPAVFPLTSEYIIDAYIKSDLQLRYRLFDGSVDLFFGIDNVLDVDAPPILSGLPFNATGTDTFPEVYDPIGRTYYGGIKARF